MKRGSREVRPGSGAGVFIGSPHRGPIPRIDNVTHRLLRASPEAVALRTRAVDWQEAVARDGLDHAPGCRHERTAERAHRAFLQAAYEYGLAVQRRGSEHMHLWARSGELIDLIALSREARTWVAEYGWEGKAIMVQFQCERLTVRSPLDRRRRRTFGPREATWASIDSEAEKVRYERALGLRHDPWVKPPERQATKRVPSQG